MNESQFVNQNQKDWQRLQTLTLMVEQKPSEMSAKEVDEFVRLYRKTSGAIARARTESSNTEIIEDLNRRVINAHQALFARGYRQSNTKVKDVLVMGAQAFRRQFPFVVVSLSIFLVATAFAHFMMATRPDLRGVLIPAGWEPVYEQWKTGVHDEKDLSGSTEMTLFYASNNPLVALRTAAWGAGTFGLMSIFMLWNTGIMMGSLLHEVGTTGKTGFLLSSIAPHGASELSGLIVVGAAGLCLGWASIAPGNLRRVDSLRIRGKDALILLAMGVLMMYIAAPFEGFFSFNPDYPQGLKVLVGVAIFAAWCCYWAFAGKSKPSSTSDTTRKARMSRRTEDSSSTDLDSA
jgi:uncharacterized membrane protein SpoIIM required for sporulation